MPVAKAFGGLKAVGTISEQVDTRAAAGYVLTAAGFTIVDVRADAKNKVIWVWLTAGGDRIRIHDCGGQFIRCRYEGGNIRLRLVDGVYGSLGPTSLGTHLVDYSAHLTVGTVLNFAVGVSDAPDPGLRVLRKWNIPNLLAWSQYRSLVWKTGPGRGSNDITLTPLGLLF